MKKIPSILAAMIICGVNVYADEPAKKTLAIVYEDGKTPEALFHTSLGYFKKAIETGDLKSAELGSAKIFGEVIDIQTATDSTTIAKRERDVAAIAVRNSIEATNLPYTARFSIHPTNLLFGDKSLGYAINPYRGCYDHDFLAKGLEKTGFKIVDASEQPDVTMTIGIDMCMSENEFKEYIQKNTSLKVKNDNAAGGNHTNASLGDDLIRSGSSTQLGTPTGGGNAGMAVAGVGLALNMVNWLATKTPQERDLIRYHVKFEGKDKTPLEFYPFILSKNTHKEGTPIDMSSYQEPEKMLFSSFIAWYALGSSFKDQLSTVLFEKDILKATEMVVASKNTKSKETNQ